MRKKKLPLDIIQIIVAYSDQQTKYQLGLTNRLISRCALYMLWDKPLITNVHTLELFVRTLRLQTPFYPYEKWVKSLSLNMVENNLCYTCVPDTLFDVMPLLDLNTLILRQLNIIFDNTRPSSHFHKFLTRQLNEGITELHFHECASSVTETLAQIVQKRKRQKLEMLCFFECSIYDSHIQRLTEFCPNLKTLKLDRCGCFSDDGLVPVAKNCPDLRVLRVTLPSSIIQSNTITVKTLVALKQHCLQLEKFVCGGQLRIIDHVIDENKYSFKIDIQT